MAGINHPGWWESPTEMTGGGGTKHSGSQREGLWLGIGVVPGRVVGGGWVQTVNVLIAGPDEPLVHVPQDR